MPRVATGRPTGRPPGRIIAKTIQKLAPLQAYQDALREAWPQLSDAEIMLIMPKDIFRLVAQVALKMRDVGLALRVASEWAPYEHPKLINQQMQATVSILDTLSIDEQREVRATLLALTGESADPPAGNQSTSH